MHRAVLLLVFAGACSFQPPGLGALPVDIDAARPTPPPDAQTDARTDAAVPVIPPDATPLDAPAPVMRCDLTRLITGTGITPEPVANVNTPDVDRDPFITADGRTMYLMSTRTGSQADDIWVTTRADRDADFSAPANATELNSSSSDTRAALTEDQLTLVLSTVRGGSFDVYITERENDEDAFGALVSLDEVNTGGSEHDPVFSLDGLRLYLSAPGTSGNRDIVVARRDNREQAFSTPQALATINTGADEADPALTADELVIFFARNNDIFYATRASTDQDFSTPQPLTSINTGAEESDPFVTADGCEFLFASSRPGGAGNLDIYRVRLQP